MKNSTRKSFCEKVVGGLVFYHDKQSVGIPIFIGVAGWFKKGMPENVYVHDGVDRLLAAGIPLSDAMHLEGKYIRTSISKPRKSNIKQLDIRNKKRKRCSKIELVNREFITNSDAKSKRIR